MYVCLSVCGLQRLVWLTVLTRLGDYSHCPQPPPLECNKEMQKKATGLQQGCERAEACFSRPEALALVPPRSETRGLVSPAIIRYSKLGLHAILPRRAGPKGGDAGVDRLAQAPLDPCGLVRKLAPGHACRAGAFPPAPSLQMRLWGGQGGLIPLPRMSGSQCSRESLLIEHAHTAP